MLQNRLPNTYITTFISTLYMKVHVYSTPEKKGKKEKEKGKRKNHKYINTQPETDTHKIKEIIFKNSLYGLGKY